MSKRWLAGLMAIVVVISVLSGCGGATEPTETVPTVAEAPAPSPDLTEDPLAPVYAIFAEADARREAIRSSPTSIVKSEEFVPGETYTGTAYYISNSGDDTNDGLTPDTAFATMEPLRKRNMQFGDAIFFERGGLWRACEMPVSMWNVEGITVSAYGEGAKPKIYASSEEGSGEEKWELYYEDDSGKKIWKYYRPMTECGAIVINDETVVKRDVAWWDGQMYQSIDDFNEATGKEYRVEEQLADLWCFPAYRPRVLGDERVFRHFNSGTQRFDYEEGDLFLRCDGGNPGALYENIEFIQPYTFADGLCNYTVYDNLHFAYSTFTLGPGPNVDNCVIQNCELAWMGGNVVHYAAKQDVEKGSDWINLNHGLYGRNGGCLCMHGSNEVIRNNYIRGAYQEGIALETFVDEETMCNNVVSGNLIENCVQALLVCNWDVEVNPEHIIRDCVIEDNIVLFAGKNNFLNYDWEVEWDANCFKFQGGPCANEGLVVRDNVFALAEATLVHIDVYSEDYSRVFENNTYIQFEKKINGIRLTETRRRMSETVAREWLGDESPTIYEVPADFDPYE